MILTIDVGNTNIKVAVFKQVNLIEKFVFQKNELQNNFEKILKEYPNCANAVLSSVGKLEESDVLWLKSKLNLIEINRNATFPFLNLYGSPKTLGVDRMVLAAGAVLLYPNQNTLIIDAGTCVTYDFVTSKNEYLGGAISPGLRLRYESLHNFTANLPLLHKKSPENFIGNTTDEAIHSGVVNGLCNEIEGFVSQYSVKNEQFTIILTGGDANFLANRLKSIIFADENFLLKSLQQLYTYSLQND
ncbi:type III pantothenate kinase [Flavobacterium difficile]|uniref:Type III pantothenate kinase n=1 Tax=Flavobacterium difficile TaxID=2709659 RepID=A0ABX0I4N6_9FLAO|nr:type III pantothenate kinase [Flavobacterium difficile]NHM01691.1 type III pantothenate kinase [Flavobacterium difficile]